MIIKPSQGISCIQGKKCIGRKVKHCMLYSLAVAQPVRDMGVTLGPHIAKETKKLCALVFQLSARQQIILQTKCQSNHPSNVQHGIKIKKSVRLHIACCSTICETKHIEVKCHLANNLC